MSLYAIFEWSQIAELQWFIQNFMSYVINIRLFRVLIFFYNGVELDELTLMMLAVVD